jgi:hypothetical protein
MYVLTQAYLWRTGYGDPEKDDSSGAGANKSIILAANKSDLERSRTISQEGTAKIKRKKIRSFGNNIALK